MEKVKKLIDKLYKTRSLEVNEYKFLIENISDEAFNYAKEKGMAPMKYNIEIKADPDWNGGIEGWIGRFTTKWWISV